MREHTCKRCLPQWSVTIAAGFHLFPYRTQQLRPHTPKVLGWRRPGRIGSCRPDKELSAEQALGSLHYAHSNSTGAERRRPSTFFCYMVRAARREADEAETSGATQACHKARRGETGATTRSRRSGWSSERVEMPWEDSCRRPDKELSAD